MSQLMMMRNDCSPSKLNVSESCSSDWSPQAAARQSRQLMADLGEGVLLVVRLLGLAIIGVLVVVGGAVCTCTSAIASGVSGSCRWLAVEASAQLGHRGRSKQASAWVTRQQSQTPTCCLLLVARLAATSGAARVLGLHIGVDVLASCCVHG